VFFGLDEPLAGELEGVLSDPGRAVVARPLCSVSECREMIDGLGPDLVFCPAEGRHYRVLLEAARQAGSALPVVVVSRRPQVSEWLDALEDGAADYCAAPFETTQMSWILDTCLGSRKAFAATE
jgi:DNA-binding NtrC family response regulator